MSEKIKPCPFCGAEVYISDEFGKFYPRANHADECPMDSLAYLTEEGAIAAWNHRAFDEAMAKAREALVEARLTITSRGRFHGLGDERPIAAIKLVNEALALLGEAS
jgi:hypothetical protein